MPGYIIETNEGYVAADSTGWLKLTHAKAEAGIYESQEDAKLIAKGLGISNDWKIVEVRIAFP